MMREIKTNGAGLKEVGSLSVGKLPEAFQEARSEWIGNFGTRDPRKRNRQEELLADMGHELYRRGKLGGATHFKVGLWKNKVHFCIASPELNGTSFKRGLGLRFWHPIKPKPQPEKQGSLARSVLSQASQAAALLHK